LTFVLATAGLVTVMGYFYNGPQDVTHYSTSIQPNEASTQPKIATVLEAAQLQENASAGFVSRKTQHQERESLDFLDPEQITRILRKNEESYHVDRKRGVLRFDLAQVPSNDPVEDSHSEILLEAPAVGNVSSGGDWMFWGIYDGHA
jgi:pyruvate dehydrogenase phosphatase